MKSCVAHSRGRSAATTIPSRIVLALGCLALSVGVGHAQNYASTVADLARFATWPRTAQHGLSFRICLRDDDPAFGDFMVLKDRTVGGRPVSLHSVEPSALGTQPCHIVYFSSGYASPEMLASLKAQPVLTVSPQPGFASAGGLVELGRDGSSLTIGIDRASVIDHPLRINAQLLDLAREVSP